MGYEIIKELAKQKGISLESISEHVGISYNSLSKIVRNTVNAPRYSTIKRIAEALGMSVDELGFAIGATDASPDGLHSPYNLTSAERTIIERYRNLDKYGKDLVSLVLDKEHERCKTT